MPKHPIDRIDDALATAQEVSSVAADTIKHVRNGSNAATKMWQSGNLVDAAENGAHVVLSSVRVARRATPVVESAFPIVKALLRAMRRSSRQ